MKTFTTNQLREASETEMTAPKGSPFADAGVTDCGAGIAEIRNMRVGCWRAPIGLGTEPTAA